MSTETFGVFDFGLDEQQEARSRKLHEESIIVDALFQGPVGYRVYDEEMNTALRAKFDSHRDLMRAFREALTAPIRLAIEGRLDAVKDHWDQSGVTCGNRQVELADDTARDVSFAFAQLQFDRFDWLTKALTADDIRRAKANGSHAGLVSSQVLSGPWRDLDALATYHDFGLRMCQLTYNSMTSVGAGCTRTDRPRARMLLSMTMVFGCVEAATGFMPTYTTMLIMLMPTGAAVLMVATACSATVQLGTTPDMRGRVMALYILAFVGGMPLGLPLVGMLAEAFGPRSGLIAGGTVCAVGSVVVFLVTTRRRGVRVRLHLSRRPHLHVLSS